MSGSTLYLIVLLLVLIVVIKLCVIKVLDNQEFIVERKGEFSKILPAGIHFFNPVFNKIVYRAYLDDEISDLKPVTVKSEEGKPFSITASITLRVTNAQTAYYSVDNYKKAAMRVTSDALKETAATIKATEMLSRSEYIEKNVQRIVNKITSEWGVTTVLVDITKIRQ